ncbi:hypothetical protein GCM10007919_28810 [Rhizobium indigoferae]|nr:hypothetical protein GCM10007919_28810 [Rhizobium indigoferae]
MISTGERERYRQRLEEARRRLASYQSRQGGDFAFASELAEKRRQLRQIEAELAAEAREAGTVAPREQPDFGSSAAYA